MKHLLLSITFVLIYSCTHQTERGVITEVGYIPEQKPGVSDENYRQWTMRLHDTYNQIDRDSGNITNVDHLNIATAFIQLNESKQRVLDQWSLAQQKDMESTAEVFPLIYQSAESVAGYLSQTEYDSLIKKFTEVMTNKEEVKVDPEDYARENDLDPELVKTMADLMERDQEFRMTNIEKQQLIDQENILIIDSLFEIHRKYIGKTLVGEEYQHSMWAVIQHSDLEHQESYLPVVHTGVLNGELPETPLKMLIDRVYKKKFGYQIFGSQSGGELADDATIQKVKKEYGL